MKQLFLILLVSINISYIYAQNKIQQRTVERNNKTFVIDNNREYLALRILSVKFWDASNLQNKYHVIRYNKLNYADIEVPLDYTIENYAALLEQDTNIVKIDYNSEGVYTYIYPNDFHLPEGYHLNATNVMGAWSLTTGNPNVKVAILDSGTDWLHPDLGLGNDSYQNIYCNPLENDWTNVNNPTTGNHLDDDSNGLIDDYKGWNFDLNTNDSRGYYFHGTFVAGLIGAKTNNNIGIAGIAGGNNSKGVSLIPYCVGLRAPNSDIIDEAIISAVDNGARIIQFSLTCQYSSAIETALQYAKANGVIVVCASGNDSSSTLPFPSSDTTVIAVGAIDKDFKRADFSNYGSNLRLVAPGVQIRSLNVSFADSLYITASGTSFAAPQVSGAIALMLSVNPNLTRNEIIEIIESTAQRVGGYNYATLTTHPHGTWNIQMGYGMIDVFAAVISALRHNEIIGPPIVCDTTKYFLQNPTPPDYTINWSLSNSNSSAWNYSLIGPTNQDTILIKRTYNLLIETAMLDMALSSSSQRNITPTLSVSITNAAAISNTHSWQLELPTDNYPRCTIDSTDTWYVGHSRTFTVINCLDEPDSVFTWVAKRGTSVKKTGRGRTFSYTPTMFGEYTISVTNTNSECGYATTNYKFNLDINWSLKAALNNDQLNITLVEEGEDSQIRGFSNEQNNNYTLELWHAVYGRMHTQTMQSNSAQISTCNLPQGTYVVVLKDNGKVVAQTKVQI